MQRHSFPPCPRPSPPGSCDYEPKSPRKYEIRKHLLTRHLKTEAEADALLLNLAPVARGEGATAADDDGDQDDSDNDAECEVCASAADAASMLLCDGCDDGYHMACLRPRLTASLQLTPSPMPCARRASCCPSAALASSTTSRRTLFATRG